MVDYQPREILEFDSERAKLQTIALISTFSDDQPGKNWALYGIQIENWVRYSPEQIATMHQLQIPNTLPAALTPEELIEFIERAGIVHELCATFPAERVPPDVILEIEDGTNVSVNMTPWETLPFPKNK